MISSRADKIYALIEDPTLQACLSALERNREVYRINALISEIALQLGELPDSQSAVKALARDIESALHQNDAVSSAKVNQTCRVLENIKTYIALADRVLAKECLAVIEPLLHAAQVRDRQIKREVDSHIQKINDIFEQIQQGVLAHNECLFLKKKIGDVILYTQRNKLDFTYQLHLAVTEMEPLIKFEVPVGQINVSVFRFLYYTDSRELLFLSKSIDEDWGKKLAQPKLKKVFMAHELLCKKTFAVSEQQIRYQGDVKALQEEMHIYNALKSKPCVLQIHRSEMYSKSLLGARVNYLVTEYCDRGELTDYLQVGPIQKYEFGCNILEGVKQIHAHQYVHRDIKPSNIFIKTTESGLQAVIGDFGFACPVQNCTLDNIKGTPFYLPLEILKNQKAHSYLTDAWSVGVVFSELFNGRLPFNDEINKISQLRKVLRKLKLEKPSVQLSKDYVIWGLLQPEPSRMPIAEALSLLEQVKAAACSLAK